MGTGPVLLRAVGPAIVAGYVCLSPNLPTRWGQWKTPPAPPASVPPGPDPGAEGAPGRPRPPSRAGPRPRPRRSQGRGPRPEAVARGQDARPGPRPPGRHRRPDGRARAVRRSRPWRRTRNRALYNRRAPAGRRALAPGHPVRCFGVRSSRPRAGRPGRVRAGGGGRPGAQPEHPGPARAGRPVPGRLRRGAGRSGGHALPAHPDGPAGHARTHRCPRHRAGRSARRAAPPPSRSGSTGSSVPASGGRRPPAIVYFHGGGWVTGDLDSHDAPCRLLAAASGCIVVAVDYRLAPEDPFPAAVDDALDAYAWVQRNSGEVGHAEGQVGVMGDSAGGNLAAVVALETRAGTGGGSEVPAPVAQGLVYPALDARLDSGSARSMAEGFFLTTASHGVLPELLRPRPRRSGRTRGSRRCWPTTISGLAPALVVTAGLRPAAGRRGRLRRGARQGRRRGRVPLLRRPGPRVHGHGHAARLPGPGHRGLRRHGPA